MRKEDLTDAIGNIDEDIIKETDSVRANVPVKSSAKPIFIGIASGMAALAAVIAGVIFIPKLTAGDSVPVGEYTTVSDYTTTPTDTSAPGTTTVPATASAIASEPDVMVLMSERVMPTSKVVKNVRAEKAVGENIAVGSDLMIDLYNETSENALRNLLKVTPENTFTLTKESGTCYRLSVSNEFRKNSLVKVEVSDENGEICGSWAFKTVDDFKVKTCYPADGSDNVSLDSGIEVEFTFAPSSGDLSEYVTIEPAVEIRQMYTKNRTLYIVPEKELEPDSGYRVTLNKGLPSAEGGSLEEDVSFVFRTTAFNGTSFLATTSSYNGFAESFVPGDTACIEIMCSEDLQNSEIETHLYRFDSADAYYDAIKAKTDTRWANDVKIGTMGLPDVFSTTEKPYVRTNSGNSYGYDHNSGSCFIMLPDKLTEGYYIAEVFAGDNAEYSLQYLIEVTPVSVYMINVGDDCLLYVNDTSTGKPAAGAAVEITVGGKTVTGTADSDGLVKIDASGVSGRSVLDIKYGDHRYTDCIDLRRKDETSISDLYYTYLYTDRTAYLPTDTVNVWGYIIPRARVTELPTDVTLTFLDAMTNDVTLNENGFFSTSFSFTDLDDKYGGNITMRAGDAEAASTYVTVHEYTKPTYIVDIEAPDYVILPQKDPFDVTVSATYYEGTPAEGLMIQDNETEKVYTTGEDGTFTASLKYNSRYYHPWTLSSASVNFSVTGIENSYEGAYKSIPAFLSDVMFTYDYNESTRALTVHANSMDFTNVEKWFAENYNGNIYYISNDSYDLLKGDGVSIPVTVNITHNWYEKTENGSYYDEIEKRTVTLYDYIFRNKSVGTYTLDTVNGTAVFDNLPVSGSDDGWYSIDITYNDTLGQDFTEYFSIGNSGFGWAGRYISNMELGGSFSFDTSSASRIYLLSATGEEHDTGYGDDYSDYTYQKFYEDEKLTVNLDCANAGVNIDGMFLLAVYNDDELVSYKVYDAHGTTGFPLIADRSFIPTVRYTGAYFDGRHIYKCYGGAMQFDPERRRINITAQTDAEKYDAGDTATITVNASDVLGKAISGATVQLSIVDEAAFAVADQTVDILNNMYPYNWIAVANEYGSYIQHLSQSRMYGEKGGGDGEDSVRKDFKDTAYFASAVTDAAGNCTFTVKLPDNITTWRATIQAVYMTDEERLYAGDTRKPVVVTRPVFITPIMQNTFVEGDDVSVSAKAAGISRADTITVSITGDGYNETKTILQQQTANFGKLPAGEYKVLFTAEKNGNKDAAELPLTVAETLLETDIERKLDLSDLNGITPTKYPVDIAFFDKEYILNTDILYELLSYYGDRNDIRLAAAYAWSVLYPDYAGTTDGMFRDETATGLAKILPAAEPTVEVTALMCAAAPDSVSRSAIVKKFRELMDGEMTILDRSSAYMGLAALGEPVMNEVKALLASDVNIDTQSGIYLSAALAFCGDRQAAYDTYLKYVPEIKINDSDKNAVTAYIASGSKPDQALTRTALITASVIGLPEAEGFARCLYSSEPELDSYALQLVVYLEHYVPKTNGKASFTYNDGGEQKAVDLDRHHPTYLHFTKEQFTNANFTVTNGDVVAMARYIGRVDQNDTEPTMTVTKTYEGSFAPGETITVKLHAARYCVIYDVIPSCGKYAGYRDHGRLVTLYTDKNGDASYEFTINVDGEYVTESPVVRDYRTGEWGIGERGTVTVRSDETA